MFPGNDGASAVPPAAPPCGRAPRRNRLVVVSNRVADVATESSGGLAVAVGEALVASGGVWFGWSGETAKDALQQAPQIQRTGDVFTVTVGLTPEEHKS